MSDPVSGPSQNTPVSPRALSDATPDARYTHPSYLSPGAPGGPTTVGTPYPKWVKNADGLDVIVQDPDEEKAVAKAAPSKK